jgi:hypothetical protein
MSDTDDELLERFFHKYPKMRRVSAALEEYFAGKPVTSCCLICDELLTVTHIWIKETGMTRTWVTCPNRCTFYHDQGKK